MVLKTLILTLITFIGLADWTMASETIRMGYFFLPPHHYKDTEHPDKPTGASVIYFEKIAGAMGYGIEWVGPLPLPRLTQYLQYGTDIDGTIGFPKFPVFEKFLYYTDRPAYTGQPSFIVRKDNPLTAIESINDISRYRIGLVKSSSNRYTPVIDNNRDAIQLYELGGDGWIEQNIAKLINGRLDALFDRQQYSFPFVAASLGYDQDIKIIPAPAPPMEFYIVFSKASKKGEIILEKCNNALFKSSLSYDQFIQDEMAKVKKK